MIKLWIENEITGFINQYGRQECGGIMQSLNDCKLFHENLEIAIRNRHVPNAKQISEIIFSCGFKFAFAKQRKINFASLYFLVVLYGKYEVEGIFINKTLFIAPIYSITSKSPVKDILFFVKNKIINQLSNLDDYNDTPYELQFLENEYKKFIALILSGSLINLKYKLAYSLSENDSIIQQVFRIVLSEAISFQKNYIISDKIQYEILGHDRLKEEYPFYFEIKGKIEDYSRDIEHGLETNEPYYFEAIDDPESEISGINHYFSFLKELFFIETSETDDGIKINIKDYIYPLENLEVFFPFILEIYSEI